MSQLIHNNNKIVVMGIETSCDETSCAIVVNGREILSNVISSQIEIHKKFGGVVPEVASRNHIMNISEVVDKALLDANITLKDVDVIAVTYAPGLEGALIVGVSYAKALAYSLNIPIVGVHHIKGHICANYFDKTILELQPPFISLVVSGGHTNIILVNDYINMQVLGKTRDDAVGEAFDKVARVLGLSYPGGPKVDEAAKLGDELAIDFPKVYLDKNSYDFSFSGIKSSVLNYINTCKMNNTQINTNDVCASFQKSVVEVLVDKTIKATINNNMNKIVLAGGVSCNTSLRQKMLEACQKNNISLYIPEPIYCTDNGAMIASCGYYNYINGQVSDLTLNACANLKIDDNTSI